VVAYFLVPETGTQNRTATGATMFSGFVRLFSNPILRSRHPHRLHHRPFLIVATASSTLMKELLHRPATEFGLYFGMLPLGFIIGTIISSPAWAIASVELFVVVGIRDAAGAFSARLLHDDGAGNFTAVCPGRRDGHRPRTGRNRRRYRRLRSKFPGRGILLRCTDFLRMELRRP
jgi:hypothetical protein